MGGTARCWWCGRCHQRLLAGRVLLVSSLFIQQVISVEPQGLACNGGTNRTDDLWTGHLLARYKETNIAVNLLGHSSKMFVIMVRPLQGQKKSLGRTTTIEAGVSEC